MSKYDIFWDFKLLNRTDYNLEMEFEINNRLMHYLFKKSVKKLKSKGININSDEYDKVNSFPVRSEYLNFLRTINKPNFNSVLKDIKNPVKLINDKIIEANFIRSNNTWIIKILYMGVYQNE